MLAITSLMPSNKTTKILLRFCHPMTTMGSSHISSLRDLGLNKPSLPKDWVYAVDEAHIEAKAEVVDPALYQGLRVPITHSLHWHLDNPYNDPE
jgi:hypothetical protein